MMAAEKFSASVAGRHMACHASANLDLAIPNWVPPVEDPAKDNAANRGTRMHEMFAEVMSLGARDLEKFSMAVQYVADIRQRRRFSVLIEQPVHAEWLVTRPGTTADLVLYTKDEIHVIDLKTGKLPVEVVGNSQLLFYAACYGHLAPKATGVTVHIVQPWAQIMEGWFASSQVIEAFMLQAQMAELAIQQGDTAFGPGDHCMFCPANPRGRGDRGRPFCPAVMELYYPTFVDEKEMLDGLD